ncbi:UNVERIFIED_CONTAM: ATP-binding cassette sub- A member 3 [Siphonaria sp. JEL0065]|nr:ATP-binding cassette sub- A member 3 [Siphonaria sp. JEL0065]
MINLRCSADMSHMVPITNDIWKPILAMLLQSLLFTTWSISIDLLSKTKGEKEVKIKKRRSWRIWCCGWFQNFSLEDLYVWQPPVVVSDEDVIAEENKIVVPKIGDGALILRKLNKQFGNFEAIKSLSFTVERGTCFALLGSNGSGKSTTFDVITGRKRASGGNIHLNGWCIAKHLSKAHESMGYCPQVDALQETHSVQEIITLYARIRGVPGKELEETVETVITRLDLVKERKKFIAHLSGGNRRKVSVAIALIGGPAVILLDEPSTGMDALSKRCVWDAIAAIRRDHAIVLTTHSMEEASTIGNRMAIMTHGQLRCLGTIQHLRSKFSSDLELDIVLRDTQVDVRTFRIPIFQIIVNSIDSRRVRLKVPGNSNLLTDSKESIGEEVEENESILSRPSNLAALFDACEGLKTAGLIEEYRISPASLEQIFMDVIKEAELSRERKKTFGGVVGVGYIRSM